MQHSELDAGDPPRGVPEGAPRVPLRPPAEAAGVLLAIHSRSIVSGGNVQLYVCSIGNLEMVICEAGAASHGTALGAPARSSQFDVNV